MLINSEFLTVGNEPHLGFIWVGIHCSFKGGQRIEALFSASSVFELACFLHIFVRLRIVPNVNAFGVVAEQSTKEMLELFLSNGFEQGNLLLLSVELVCALSDFLVEPGELLTHVFVFLCKCRHHRVFLSLEILVGKVFHFFKHCLNMLV